eukprot:CAMPEP_0198275326 /NCGR_PEP_ID=MMETSP1447-20131203/64102_1 /TAXON_ID=420782 /ORGANISM="Chaetoceros dichaeta, Strain CCMP1751" /LENGTH=154 /DNA_ID=CAMNT_0043970089 /DNA_START=87 /DNA_END=552 /DNA_ORIENTATION=+
MRQGENETNDNYLTRFKSSAKTLKLAGGDHIFVSKEMLGIYDLGTATKKKKMTEKIDSFFILRCDGISERLRYKKLLEDLRSSANRGRDEYPTTLTGAFDLLVRELVNMTRHEDSIRDITTTEDVKVEEEDNSSLHNKVEEAEVTVAKEHSTTT